MTRPPYFRLKPGGEVRLKNAYFIKCTGYETDENGNVTLVKATYDPASRGGESPDGRKVKGTIHWVSAKHAVDAEVRLYDMLFKVENPEDVPEGADYKDNLNPDSLIILKTASLNPPLPMPNPGTGSSSSAWVISAWIIRIQNPEPLFLTRPSVLKIPGRR